MNNNFHCNFLLWTEMTHIIDCRDSRGPRPQTYDPHFLCLTIQFKVVAGRCVYVIENFITHAQE